MQELKTCGICNGKIGPTSFLYAWNTCSKECARTAATIESQRDNTNRIIENLEWIARRP